MTVRNLLYLVTRTLVILAVVSSYSQSASAEWEFKLAPLFLWGISIDGDATIGTIVAPLDLQFKDDVFENMEAVFTVHFEARNDDILLFAEYQYVKLEPSVVSGPADVDIEFTNIAAEIGAGWEFYQNDRLGVEVLLGLRYLDQEIDVDGSLNLPGPPLGPGPLPIGISGGDDWIHPFLGLRSTYQLTSHWSFLARGDYGYSGSDDKAANLSFMLDYRFKGWGSAFVGYRYMDFDYSNGSGDDQYGYDAVQQGPLLGVAIYW
jgi:hypothetical protein